MFRPPAREMCLNTLEDVYQTCKHHQAPYILDSVFLTQDTDEESRPAAGKVLAKWRPQQIQAAEITTNGTAESTPAASQQQLQVSTAAE